MTKKIISASVFSWIYTLINNGLNLVLGLVTGLILARFLGPDGRGLVAAILFLPNLIAPIGLLGLNEAIVYSIGRKKISEKELFANSIFLVILLSLVVSGIGLVFIHILISDKLIQYLPLIDGYLITLVPAYFLSLMLSAFDLGNLRFKKYNLFQLVPTAFYLFTVVSLWLTDLLSVYYVVWASVFGVVITALTLWILTPDKPKIKASITTIKYLLKRGITFHLATIISLISNQLDKIFIVTFMSNKNVGYYVVAFTFASAGLYALAHATHTIMFPIIARENNLKKKKTYFYNGLWFSTLLLVVISVILFYSSQWLLPLLFGNAYVESISLAQVLIIASLPLSIRLIIIRNLRGLGISRHATIAESITLVSFLLCIIPLLNKYSLYGVGYSLIISNVMSLAYLLLILNKVFLPCHNIKK